jgi:hypothetical protein
MFYKQQAEESDGKYKAILNELESSKRSMPDPHLQVRIRSKTDSYLNFYETK